MSDDVVQFPETAVRSAGSPNTYLVSVSVRELEHERTDVEYLVELTGDGVVLTYHTHRVFSRPFRGAQWSVTGREYRAAMLPGEAGSSIAVGLVLSALIEAIPVKVRYEAA